MSGAQRWQLDDMVRRQRASGFTAEQIRWAIIDLARTIAPPDIAQPDIEAFLEDHGLSGE
jgi:hypothetical protein